MEARESNVVILQGLVHKGNGPPKRAFFQVHARTCVTGCCDQQFGLQPVEQGTSPRLQMSSCRRFVCACLGTLLVGLDCRFVRPLLPYDKRPKRSNGNGGCGGDQLCRHGSERTEEQVPANMGNSKTSSSNLRCVIGWTKIDAGRQEHFCDWLPWAGQIHFVLLVPTAYEVPSRTISISTTFAASETADMALL